MLALGFPKPLKNGLPLRGFFFLWSRTVVGRVLSPARRKSAARCGRFFLAQCSLSRQGFRHRVGIGLASSRTAGLPWSYAPRRGEIPPLLGLDFFFWFASICCASLEGRAILSFSQLDLVCFLVSNFCLIRMFFPAFPFSQF